MMGTWTSSLRVSPREASLLIEDEERGDLLKARLPLSPRHPRADRSAGASSGDHRYRCRELSTQGGQGARGEEGRDPRDAEARRGSVRTARARPSIGALFTISLRRNLSPDFFTKVLRQNPADLRHR